MLKSNFNEHALATARSVGCDVKPTTDTFTQSNRHFATRRGFALLLPYVRRSKFTLYGEQWPPVTTSIRIGSVCVCGERDQRASRYRSAPSSGRLTSVFAKSSPLNSNGSPRVTANA